MPGAPSQTRATSAYSSTVSPHTFTSKRRVVPAQARQHVPDEGVDPDALQPDRVQQARRASPRSAAAARRRAARGRAPSRRCRRARDRSIEALVLDAVAEGARRREQRVLEPEAGELDREAHDCASVGASLACARLALAGPDDARRVEHRPLGAGAPVLPAGVVRALDPDDAAEARPDAAPHPRVEADLGLEPSRGRDPRDGVHHRLGAARVERRGPGRGVEVRLERHRHASRRRRRCRPRSPAPRRAPARAGAPAAAGRRRCGRRRRGEPCRRRARARPPRKLKGATP